MPWVEITGLEDKKLRFKWVSGKLSEEESAMLRAYWDAMYAMTPSRRHKMTKRAYGLAGLALFLLAVLIAQRSGVL